MENTIQLDLVTWILRFLDSEERHEQAARKIILEFMDRETAPANLGNGQ